MHVHTNSLVSTWLTSSYVLTCTHPLHITGQLKYVRKHLLEEFGHRTLHVGRGLGYQAKYYDSW